MTDTIVPPLTPARQETLESPTTRTHPLLAAIHRRVDAFPPWVLLIQLFIGMGWFRAGIEKAISSSWWTGAELTDFLDDHADETVRWYEPFVEFVVAPNVVAFSAAVMVVQFAIGAAMVAGRRVFVALGIGMFLNLHFIAAGAVNPSVFYLLAQGAVLLWLAEHSTHRRAADVLEIIIVAGLGLAAISMPLTETLMPAEVIDDPALILATAGCLAALCSYLCHRRRAVATTCRTLCTCLRRP